MVNPGVYYNVTGRYMDGREVIGYHLVGEDGSQSQETRDRVIYLIRNEVIKNMRIQIGDNNEVILRGKGVNLNNLPVYDLGKQQFRNDSISQQAATTGVNVNRNVTGSNPMGQYRILRRITYKNKCLGYEVQDYSGAICRKKREQVVKLAAQRLVSNAVAQKCVRPGSDMPEIILRGVNCDLKSLPILIVDNQGKIIDPLKEKNKLSIRAAYMMHNGIIRDSVTSASLTFNAGDFIVCNPDGSINILPGKELGRNYIKGKDVGSAVCDDYLGNVGRYSIEVFGKNPIVLSDKIIKSWAILLPVVQTV